MPNNTTDCGISIGVLNMREKIYFLTYYVLTAAYFFIGFFGNVLLLIAFNNQFKKEKAYMYQFMVTISKTFETVAFTTFVLTRKLSSGFENSGVDWFKKSYYLMWYAARLSAPLINGFITSSLLFSLAMAADRVFALSKPFKYKTVNHPSYHLITLITCFSLGLSSSLFDCFRLFVSPDGDAFKIGIDEVYVATTAAIILSQMRNAIRIVGLFGLISLDVAIAVMFRKRSQKVAQMTSNDQREQNRKQADTTLLLLTVWQSILTCLTTIPVICYYFIVYISPKFTGCWGSVMVPFNDGTLAVAEAIDFFVVMAINKKTRRMICGALPHYKCVKINEENMATTAASASARPMSQR